MSDQTFEQNKRQFIELLKDGMRKKHLNNVHLAKLAGISEGTIRNILRDDDPRTIGPHPQVIRAICQVLDLDPIIIFQMLGYLPPASPWLLTRQYEQVAFRVSRLPLDKEKILMGLLDSLEESVGLRTPDSVLNYVLKAVLQLRKDHPMFENRDFGFREEIAHRVVQLTPAWQNPPMRSQLVERFQFSCRNDPTQVINETRLNETIENPAVIIAIQMLIPRRDMPSTLEKLYWLCFWDSVHGSLTEKLSEEHQAGFRALWLLLCDVAAQVQKISTEAKAVG